MPNSLGFGVVPNIQSPVDSDSIKYFSPRIGASTISNRPAFRVYGSNSTNITATTTLTTTQGVTIDYNQGSYLNNTTGVFTAPVAGLYQINVNVRNGGNASYSQLICYKNGSPVMVMIEFAGNSTMNHAGGSTIAKLAVGDTLTLKCAAGSLSFDGNDNWSVAYLG